MSLEVNDRVLIKPLGVKGTVIRNAQPPVAGRYVVRADSATQDVVWSESELEKLASDS